MLAERLGKTRQQLINELSLSELAEWIAFDKLKDPVYKASLEQSMRTPEEQEAWILSQLNED